MRILMITGAIMALGAVPAAAQTSNPIQTIELPPSVSVEDDPFAPVPDEAEVAEVDAEAALVEGTEAPPRVSRALAAGAAAVGDTGTAGAGGEAGVAARSGDDTSAAGYDGGASVVGRVDAIMETLLGPSEEEQRAVAARLYAEQAERHRLEMQRVETLNREARAAVDAENRRRLDDHRAAVQRQAIEHAASEQARMDAWRAQVAACEAGVRSACAR